MKYVVTSTLLFGRLQAINRIIESKNDAPILSCFLFDFQENNLQVTATNKETVMRFNIPLVEGDSPAKIAIPAKQILDVLKEIPEQPLSIEFNATNLQITLSHMSGRFILQGEQAEDFPLPIMPEGDFSEIAIQAPTLNYAFTCALNASETNETRKLMNSVFVDISQQDISVVGSDGHKLVCCKLLCDTQNTQCNLLFPRRTAQLLNSAINKSGDAVRIKTFDNKKVVVEQEDFSMFCLLMEERFPNYRNVIPQNNENIITVDKAALQSALRRVMVAADKTSSLIKFNIEANNITLIAEDLNYGQNAEEKLMCQYEGIPMRIGFPGNYFLELLNNIQCREVYIKLNDPSRAGLILPVEQTEGTDLIMLLMPVMIVS